MVNKPLNEMGDKLCRPVQYSYICKSFWIFPSNHLTVYVSLDERDVCTTNLKVL